jgi:tRNA-dihydrouridine synthase C
MQLLLAPMEGLLDFALRDTLTRVSSGADYTEPHSPDGKRAVASADVHPSGIDRCVSEFIRITDTLLPARAFIRTMPELCTGGRTLTGVPVRGQLLGSDPTLLAENAARLAELGSHGVDLNFGCPANVVNRHGGGSALLDDPELIHRIVAAVRRAVPAHVPVSAKMRLGYNDDHRAEDNALAIEAAGACEIVVHARTKAHGYRPPAYWDRIADLAAEVKLPLVANGEIWTVEDALRCQQVSGCSSLMLGRGMVADPGLALAIRAALAADPPATSLLGGVQGRLAENFQSNQALALDQYDFLATQPAARPGSACGFTAPLVSSAGPHVPWSDMQPLLASFWQWVELRVARRHRAGRLKQWLNLLRRRYPEAQAAFDELRISNDADQMAHWLQGLQK